MKKYTLLRTFMLFIAALILCGWFSIHTQAAITKGVKAPEQTVCFEPDTTSVLKNPLTGWVMYLGRAWDENFWQTQRYDAMPVNGGDSTVRVSDYAGTCYIRINWNMLESKEGKYVWNDPDSRIYKLLASVRERGMRLAFRINVDSRDQGQNTPLYVKEAGAKGFQDPNNSQIWSPYPDDAVFQQKYEKFLQAFAVAFDDPDKVDFIDAYGLGKWGEAHGVKYNDYSKKEEVFEWITDVMSRLFTKVPIMINYHRCLLSTKGSGDVDTGISADLVKRAVAKGFCLRHDAFGMKQYYKDWERGIAAAYRGIVPITMEGGWVESSHGGSIAGDGYKNFAEVRQGEYDEAKGSYVNMMDFRFATNVNTGETHSWFNTAFHLVKEFIAEGGYRLYPDRLSIPTTARSGSNVSLTHRWSNLGWGYCPTNLPQYGDKYKLAIALLDKNTEKPARIYIEEKADIATWMSGKPKTYTSNIKLTDVAAGTYTWAVGLVDTTKENAIGILLSARDEYQTAEGWVKVGDITIQ